jgi:hypothetical protein
MVPQIESEDAGESLFAFASDAAITINVQRA